MGRPKKNKPRKIRRAPDGFVSPARIAELADELADLSAWSVTAVVWSRRSRTVRTHTGF
ncbi:hypothetical protein ACH3XX_20155 [Streptomyces scabiei]|uniref:hypothetical protein n=1 Tax=Streptomyces scabiei TaxID=1930 RepID=UPI0037B11735